MKKASAHNMSGDCEKPARVVNVRPPDDISGEFKRFGGSDYDEFNLRLANQVSGSIFHFSDSTDAGINKRLEATICALAGISPGDVIEGILAGQLVACHNVMMECMRRAMINDQPFEVSQEYIKQGSKLARTSAQLVATLDKHRGKGQQKVTVEHVHVHEGGQAIVGNVEQGGKRKRKGQGHAKHVAHAPEPEMRSALKTDGETVPTACNGERTV